MTRRDRFLSLCLAAALGVTAACFVFYPDVIEEAVCCSKS